jgi:hypothetical protein
MLFNYLIVNHKKKDTISSIICQCPCFCAHAHDVLFVTIKFLIFKSKTIASQITIEQRKLLTN